MKAERLIRACRDDLRELAHGPCPSRGKHHDDEGREITADGDRARAARRRAAPACEENQ